VNRRRDSQWPRPHDLVTIASVLSCVCAYKTSGYVHRRHPSTLQCRRHRRCLITTTRWRRRHRCWNNVVNVVASTPPNYKDVMSTLLLSHCQHRCQWWCRFHDDTCCGQRCRHRRRRHDTSTLSWTSSSSSSLLQCCRCTVNVVISTRRRRWHHYNDSTLLCCCRRCYHDVDVVMTPTTHRWHHFIVADALSP